MRSFGRNVLGRYTGILQLCARELARRQQQGAAVGTALLCKPCGSPLQQVMGYKRAVKEGGFCRLKNTGFVNFHL